jgi:transcriptional regulator with XRE-family HTH domain
MNIAKRLRNARERAGLTQDQAALYGKLNVKDGGQYISKLERGKNNPPTWDHLAKLAKVYRTSTDYLLCLTDDWRSPENRTLPEGGSELLEYLTQMSPRGRETVLAVVRVLAESDQWWQEREGATLMAIGISNPGELERLAGDIRWFTERFGSLSVAINHMLSLERSAAEPVADEGVE